MDLNDIPYAEGASFDSTKQCLPGTRIGALDEITQWVNRTNDENRIYMLYGAAGTGKSAIAHTIAGRFDQLGRLGSSFCFNRTFQSSRRVDNMFGTIARDLADREPQIKQVLWRGIRGNKALRTTPDLIRQLENFILNPAKKMEIVGPIVIVIDALDESGDRPTRRQLLDLLAQRLAELPANFRILITSRPDDDILKAFDGKPHVFSRSIDEFASSTKEDIIKYIKDAISQYQHLEFIDEPMMNLLADKSEGLFQWVSTVCMEIVVETPGSTPEELFASFTSSDSKGQPLDALYRQILDRHFPLDPSNPDSVVEEFEVVIGQIMTAFEPLSIISLAEMRRQCDSKSKGDRSICERKILSIVKYLGSLLSGVTEASKSVAIRPFHTSFRDFLTDRRRSTRFCVDKSVSHPTLTLASLRIMKELRYNICGLETTSLRNRDISNLPALIDKCIPQHLSYACRFWGRHLEATERLEPSLQEGVNHFIYDLLLYWLEALSLVGASHISASTLLYVANRFMVRVLPDVSMLFLNICDHSLHSSLLIGK
jgi:NACHT domain